MAHHLMRAQGAYKADKHATSTHVHTHKHPHTPTPTRTHTHTHTHEHARARKNTSIVVMGFDGNRRKKARNQ